MIFSIPPTFSIIYIENVKRSDSSYQICLFLNYRLIAYTIIHIDDKKKCMVIPR